MPNKELALKQGGKTDALNQTFDESKCGYSSKSPYNDLQSCSLEEAGYANA